MGYGEKLKMFEYTDLKLRGKEKEDSIHLYKVSKEIEGVDLGVNIGRGI